MKKNEIKGKSGLPPMHNQKINTNRKEMILDGKNKKNELKSPEIDEEIGESINSGFDEVSLGDISQKDVEL